MRLFIVEHGLKSVVGHHYNNTLGYLQEARRRGIETRLYVHDEADEQVIEALGGRPVFPYDPYRSISDDPFAGPFEDLAQLAPAFARGCAAMVEDGVTADDVVFLPLAFDTEIQGLALWLESLPSARAPRLALNFMMEQPPRLHPSVSRILRLASYRYAANHLARATSRDRVILSAQDQQFARRLGEMTGFPVEVFPHAKSYGDPDEGPQAHEAGSPDGRILVSLLGHSRHEKGFRLIPEIIRRCSEADPRLDFFVQVAPEKMTTSWGEAFEALRAMQNVELHLGALSREAYFGRLREADIVLLPYDSSRFVGRPSGIFSEGVAHGKVAVVPTGTWMSGHLESGMASGRVFERYSADSIALTLLEAAAGFDELATKARACAADWRRSMSVSGFMDRLLERLQAREEASGGASRG